MLLVKFVFCVGCVIFSFLFFNAWYGIIICIATLFILYKISAFFSKKGLFIIHIIIYFIVLFLIMYKFQLFNLYKNYGISLYTVTLTVSIITILYIFRFIDFLPVSPLINLIILQQYYRISKKVRMNEILNMNTEIVKANKWKHIISSNTSMLSIGNDRTSESIIAQRKEKYIAVQVIQQTLLLFIELYKQPSSRIATTSKIKLNQTIFCFITKFYYDVLNLTVPSQISFYIRSYGEYFIYSHYYEKLSELLNNYRNPLKTIIQSMSVFKLHFRLDDKPIDILKSIFHQEVNFNINSIDQEYQNAVKNLADKVNLEVDLSL